MSKSVVGGILLVVGTSIGGGMLALPMITASLGFFNSMVLFFVVWALMTLSAFLILEINLSLPKGSNLISMARMSLGRTGACVTWFVYLLLLYSLLSAYLAGGGDLLQHLSAWHFSLTLHQSIFVFAAVFAGMVYGGVRCVDWLTRVLMLIKFVLFVLLLLFISPHVSFERLELGQAYLFQAALAASTTSFGFAIIVPTLCDYYDNDLPKLKQVLFIGSLIPLICYILWVAVVRGSLLLSGPYGLVSISHSAQSVSRLTEALAHVTDSVWLNEVVHSFSAVCLVTSFLGVCLCCVDFIADGLGIKKLGWSKLIIFFLTLAPPLLISQIIPRAFVLALSYAGLWCILLLILLPMLMAYSNRYILKNIGEYQVMGGKSTLIIGGFLALVALLVTIQFLFL